MFRHRTIVMTFAAVLASAVSHVQAQWGVNGAKIFYSAGDVGIGTGSPKYKLDVKSTGSRVINAQATATTGTTYGVYSSNKSTTGRALYGKATATSGVNYGVYGVTNSPDGFGGFFVGDVNVDGQLLLNGDTMVADDGFGRREFFHENGVEHMEFNGFNTTFDNVRVVITHGLAVNHGPTDSVTEALDVNGNVRCVSVIQTSSREFKQDISPLSGALNKIMSLNPVTYAWNDKAPKDVQGKRDIGFIADEVNQVLPDIVAKDNDGKPTGIDYGKIVPVAVEAIKQLKAENEELKARLAKLESAVVTQSANDAKK